MKTKLQIIIACFLILTSYTAKSQTSIIIPGYDDNDVQKLQTFFAQTDGTTTNGVKMNSTYNSTDPTTWTGVIWDMSSPKRATNIDVSYKNMVSSFDCSSFTALTNLNCSNNQLTALNVTGNTALIHLDCHYNQLPILDVSGNTALLTLYCNDNKLPTLNISANTALTDLNCSYNQLSALDVTTNTALINVDCSNNQLPSLDVSGKTALKTLDCNHNTIPTLDVSTNTALTNLNCSFNQLPSLDLSQNTALTDLNCYHNQLPILNISLNKALINLNCSYNQLPSLDLSQNIALKSFNCSYNQLPSLDISKNTLLTFLDCGYNQLPVLDVSANTALANFYCANNKLSILDVTKNTALTDLGCSDNQLGSLDITKNTSLIYFKANNNQLTSLDFSANTALTSLYCSNNQLTALDLTKNTALINLDCSSNTLKFSDIQHSSTATAVTDSPQRPFIPIGVTTTGGTMAAAIGDTINLKLETNIDEVIGAPLVVTKFRVWKKAADGTITEVTTQCSFTDTEGLIKLPLVANDLDSLCITMSNTTYPNFVEQTTPVTSLTTTMRTRTFALVGAEALPIELLSFTANLNNNKVDLAWSTASEKNNAFFTVERSVNNKDWESVTKVNGAGNSNTQLNYSTIDENPLSGVSYYRLKQTDFDGKFEYSKTVVINRNAKTTIQLYPNPATDQISVTGNEEELNSIKIYNSLGQDVTKYTNYSVSNTKQKQIDISKLTTGIYILKTKNTTNRLIVK